MLGLIPYGSFQHWHCCSRLLCPVLLISLWLGSSQFSSAPSGSGQTQLHPSSLLLPCSLHWCWFLSTTSWCLLLEVGEGDVHPWQRTRSAGLIPTLSLVDRGRKIMQFQGTLHSSSPGTTAPNKDVSGTEEQPSKAYMAPSSTPLFVTRTSLLKLWRFFFPQLYNN